MDQKKIFCTVSGQWMLQLTSTIASHFLLLLYPQAMLSILEVTHIRIDASLQQSTNQLMTNIFKLIFSIVSSHSISRRDL